MVVGRGPTKLAGSGATKGCGGKALSCAARIEAETVKKTTVSMTENMVQDAEALFNAHDSEGTQLLSRGALTELLRQVGLEDKMGDAFGATARLAFDAHSADSHFLSLAEFKQLYYVICVRYPDLLPRKPFLNIRVYSASGLPPADFNGKSDPFVVLQIHNKPVSKSQSTIVEKTLDPVWGKPGFGEEFSDKYAYDEGDVIDFIVHDFDKGCTEFDVLAKGRLSSSEFHRPGGFDGKIPLTCPTDNPHFKGYFPTLRVRVVVNAFEKDTVTPAATVAGNVRQGGMTGSQRFKAAARAAVGAHTLAHHSHDHHDPEHHGDALGEAVAPAGA